MKKQKYTLDKNDKIQIMGHDLYRVKAVKNFHGVKSGELGGYIESEKNLSQDGNCWIEKDGLCFENGKIIENARVMDAVIFGNAVIKGNARIFNSSNGMHIFENAVVEGIIDGVGDIYGNAVIGPVYISRGYNKCINIKDDNMDEWVIDRNVIPMDSLSY